MCLEKIWSKFYCKKFFLLFLHANTPHNSHEICFALLLWKLLRCSAVISRTELCMVSLSWSMGMYRTWFSPVVHLEFYACHGTQSEKRWEKIHCLRRKAKRAKFSFLIIANTSNQKSWMWFWFSFIVGVKTFAFVIVVFEPCYAWRHSWKCACRWFQIIVPTSSLMTLL